MKEKKKIWIGLGVVLVVIGIIAAIKMGSKGDRPSAVQPDGQGAGANPMMVIETKYGPIEIELFPSDAPKTVARIQELVKQGFYDGLSFHRVVPGFVVQGGDPLSKNGNSQAVGTGGSGQNLPAEFNSRKHLEGTVAMARAMDVNSADSQFYISLGTHPHLDGNYTVFGTVTKGIENVKKIQQGDKMDRITMKQAQ